MAMIRLPALSASLPMAPYQVSGQKLNDAAIANYAAWVPELFPAAEPYHERWLPRAHQRIAVLARFAIAADVCGRT